MLLCGCNPVAAPVTPVVLFESQFKIADVEWGGTSLGSGPIPLIIGTDSQFSIRGEGPQSITYEGEKMAFMVRIMTTGRPDGDVQMAGGSTIALTSSENEFEFIGNCPKLPPNLDGLKLELRILDNKGRVWFRREAVKK